MNSEYKKALALLIACQGLLLTNNIVNITMNSLAGFDLAIDKRWATLPLSAYTLATAVCVFPAAMWMRRVGRRSGFVLGCLLGLLGALVCALAAWTRNFALLVAGNVIAGGYNAFGQYYRFAAADSAPPAKRSTAIALVVAGGLAGAFLGPEASKLTKNALANTYLGTYLFLAVCAAIAAILAAQVGASAKPQAALQRESRSLLQLARAPGVGPAMLACALGYAVMNYLMTSTPLAMLAHHHTYRDTAFVIEWHAVAMFAPSLLLGPLIARAGTRTVIVAGIGLAFVSILVAQYGDSVPVFWFALLLLGVAWSLMYVGGTTALAESYRPSERFMAQGINDTLVFTVSAVASAGSGVLLQSLGWPRMAWIALLPLAVLSVAFLHSRDARVAPT
jgi:MFS family permease